MLTYLGQRCFVQMRIYTSLLYDVITILVNPLTHGVLFQGHPIADGSTLTPLSIGLRRMYFYTPMVFV